MLKCVYAGGKVMKKDIKAKMEELGFKEIEERQDFLFAVNKNALLIRIMYIETNVSNPINVNYLEYLEGHSYSYFVDMIKEEKDCDLEKYFNLSKEDLNPARRMKLY
jgi:hypothetical protein